MISLAHSQTCTISVETIDLLSLPSVALSDRAHLPKVPGVYFALDAQGDVLYIGKARNIMSRWATGHHRYLQLSAMDGVCIAWLQLNSVCELSLVEAKCIEYFSPRLNAVRPGRFVSSHDPKFIKARENFSSAIARTGHTRVEVARVAGVSARTLDALARPEGYGREGFTRESTAWRIARGLAQLTGQSPESMFAVLFVEVSE